MQKKLNVRYSASHFFYFTMFASMFAFASIFLLDKGFNNTTIGFVLSLTSLTSIGIQTFIANFLDKNKEVKIQKVITMIVIAVMTGAIFMLFLDIKLFILPLVVVSFSLTQATTPLLNSMAFLYDDLGVRINYGFARGIGSLAYALVTVSLGYIIGQTSPAYLPVFTILFGILLLVAIRSYELSDEDHIEIAANQKNRKIKRKKVASEKSYLEFIAHYQKIILLMVGIVFLFYGHVIINNFFIQVITPIGGTSQTLGIAVFIGTILELPAMMNFNQLSKRIPVHQLLKISAVFFLVKHILTFMAPNLTVIYIAQATQIGAFSVAYPALVEYTQTVIANEDMVKGQSLLASSMALSSIFASFTGGILLDSIGVSKTMFIAVVTTVIGLVIVFLAVEDQSVEPIVRIQE